MDGITVITTEAITIDIIIAATTTGTEDGLSRSMDAPGITAIGKQYPGRTISSFAPLNRPRMTQGSSIMAQVFHERDAAAQWLGVPVERVRASGGGQKAK
jgi:hypothetical protein